MEVRPRPHTSTTRSGSTCAALRSRSRRRTATSPASSSAAASDRAPGAEDVEKLAPGEGTVARIGGKLDAVSRTDEGELVTLSARCTHLGCIVGWNPADRAWECPCHGSRFAADGTVVQGPATKDLPPRRP